MKSERILEENENGKEVWLREPEAEFLWEGQYWGSCPAESGEDVCISRRVLVTR